MPHLIVAILLLLLSCCSSRKIAQSAASQSLRVEGVLQAEHTSSLNELLQYTSADSVLLQNVSIRLMPDSQSRHPPAVVTIGRLSRIKHSGASIARVDSTKILVSDSVAQVSVSKASESSQSDSSLHPFRPLLVILCFIALWAAARYIR